MQDDIRLMIGDQPSENQSEGRVEVCIDGVFGTVCDRYWSEFDAQVVCRKLQQPGRGIVFTVTTIQPQVFKANSSDKLLYVSYTTDHAAVKAVLMTALYGTASNFTPIHLDKVLCEGSEPSLLSCERDVIGWNITVDACDHSTDAGVKCGGTEQTMHPISSVYILLLCF